MRNCDKCSELEKCASMNVRIGLDLIMEVMEDFAKEMSSGERYEPLMALIGWRK